MMDKQKIYPRSKDRETVYLKNVVTDPSIIVGDYTMYNDWCGIKKVDSLFSRIS